MRQPLDVLPGTLDLLVLRALAGEPLHGYGVASWIKTHSKGAFVVEGTALYKSLHRLEADDLLQPEWGTSDNNRRAKFYRLTPKGRQRLRVQVTTWKSYTAAVLDVLSTAGG